MPPAAPPPAEPVSAEEVSIAVSVVVFHPDPTWLETTLVSLAAAMSVARDAGLLTRATVVLVDNAAAGSSSPWSTLLDKCMAPCAAWSECRTLAGHGNIGYGAANNLGLAKSDADYLLILNPDVQVDRNAIAGGIAYLTLNTGAGMLTPVASAPDGTPLYLVKSYPHVRVLGVRGFAPVWLKNLLQGRLDKYERADRPFDSPLTDVFLASGCFMLIRRNVFERVGGFDPAFFLYFEDFDLCVRISKVASIVRIPECRIVHAGGGASRKGFEHTRMFARSAWRFFNKHGWRW